MTPQSLNTAAARAAGSYRDEVVRRLGPTHGPAAQADWNRQRFWAWAIERVVEHVEGRVFWSECGRRNFSRLSQRPALQPFLDELRQLMHQLESDAMPAFKQREQLTQRVADLANKLLE